LDVASIFILSWFIWRVCTGVIPVLVRIGKGIAFRRVAVVASGDAADSLVSLLKGSGLVRKNNVQRVDNDSLASLHGYSLWIVHWPYVHDFIAQILDQKPDHVPLIVFAPQSQGIIPQAVFADIESHRNTTVV